MAESLRSTAKSPSTSRVKRAKTTMGQVEAPSQKVKKLYGTKTTMDDLRVREGRRNELWEQAVGSDTMQGADTKKLKRRKLNIEEEPRSFEEIMSKMKSSQESSAPGSTLDKEMDQLESALDLHNGDLDQVAQDESNPFTNIDKISGNGHRQGIEKPNDFKPPATLETLMKADAPDHILIDNSLAHAIAVSIPKHDTNISQSPIMAPSISQLANPPSQAPTKPSRKRKNSLVSSQADELASDDIGLPKEQYKPRPSRSRRQNDHVDELVKGIDYSKTVESVVRNSKKGKPKTSKAKRRQTTGCFLGSANDWDENEYSNGPKVKKQEVQVIDDSDVPKTKQRSKITAAESENPVNTLHVCPEVNNENLEQRTFERTNAMSSTMSPTHQSLKELGEVVTKPKRGRKPSSTQKSRSDAIEDIVEDNDQDDLDSDLPVKPQRRRKSIATDPAIVNANVEDAEEDDFHPLEDLPDDRAAEPKSKKKRGRPKKPDAEPNPKSGKTTDTGQLASAPPPNPISKRRKTKEAPFTERHATPPASQPLTESPTKANAILPPPDNTIPQDEDAPHTTEKVSPQFETPQKEKGNGRGKSRERTDEEPCQTPSKKPHSPLSNSKVPLRVGLSRRQRIEPLLRIRR